MYLLRYLKRDYKITTGTISLILVETALQTLSTTILAGLLDTAAARDGAGALRMFALNAVVFGAFLLFRYLAVQMRIRTVQAMVRRYRGAVCGDIAAGDARAAAAGGAAVSRLTNDAKMVEQSAFEAFFTIVESVAVVAFSAVALLSFHPLLMAVTLAFSLLILLVPNLRPIQRTLQAAQERLAAANGRYTGAVADLLAGYADLFQQDRQPLYLARAGAAAGALEGAAVASGRTRNRVETFITLLNIASQLAVALVTVVLVLRGAVSAGTLLSVGQLSGSIFNDLDVISNTVTQVLSVQGLLRPRAAASRPVRRDGPDGPVAVTLRGVNYAYGGRPVFRKPVDFTIEPGKKYAILGPSGAGKSTLVNILCGNYRDYAGSVTFGGAELRDLRDEWLHGFLILMRQKPHLFAFSVEDNIFLGAPHTQADLHRLLDACALTGVVDALPQGAATVLGSDGAQLSGGQQQRVLLARILASGCKFIILDEATSAQDQANAHAIESQLLHDPSLTVVTITHHMDPTLAAAFDGVLEL